MHIVTLTTDFGLSDEYVASMKGVVLTIAPEVDFVDISHEVPSQDVVHGAYVLATAVPFFPEGSVHVSVVDPGVGTERVGVVMSCRGSYLLGPDNGVLSLAADALLDRHWDPVPSEEDPNDELEGTIVREIPRGIEAFELANPAYGLPEISDTFHGRDVFAPAAAHLCLGVAPSSMGPRLKTIRWLRMGHPVWRQDGTLEARVLHIDRYGNAITNLHREGAVSPGAIRVQGHEIDGVSRSYAEAGADVLALWGSTGRLEIAVKNGSAAQKLGLTRGDRVLVRGGS